MLSGPVHEGEVTAQEQLAPVRPQDPRSQLRGVGVREPAARVPGDGVLHQEVSGVPGSDPVVLEATWNRAAVVGVRAREQVGPDHRERLRGPQAVVEPEQGSV